MNLTKPFTHWHITHIEEQCHKSKNAHFELCSQEVCLRPHLPSVIASHVYFLKWPREGRSVVLLKRLHRPGHCLFLSAEKLYFSSCDSVLLGVRHICKTRIFFSFETNWLNKIEKSWFNKILYIYTNLHHLPYISPQFYRKRFQYQSIACLNILAIFFLTY
jgi:hypothetical protein